MLIGCDDLSAFRLSVCGGTADPDLRVDAATMVATVADDVGSLAVEPSNAIDSLVSSLATMAAAARWNRSDGSEGF